jgi:hypothetical protein
MEQRMDVHSRLPMAPYQPTTDAPEDVVISDFLWGPLAARALPVSMPVLALDRVLRAERALGSQINCEEMPGSQRCEEVPGSQFNCEEMPGSLRCEEVPGSQISCEETPGSQICRDDPAAE